MADRNTKLREYSLDYGKKSEDFARNNRPVPKDAASLDERGVNLKRSKDSKSSKTPNLYRLLQKNADSMVKYGTRAFPNMSLDQDNFQFSNSKRLSKTLDDLTEPIKALGSFKAKATTPNGVPVNPCMVSHDGGETETEHMLNKTSSDNLSSLKLPGLSKIGIDYCADGPECYDCLDCEPHRKELRKAWTGILSDNPEDDDVRMMHVKNLASTLNSWASHHDTRGGNADTCNAPGYRGCNDLHQTMATHLRSMADNITNAIKGDYEDTKGYGGAAEHRDAIYGSNKMEA